MPTRPGIEWYEVSQPRIFNDLRLLLPPIGDSARHVVPMVVSNVRAFCEHRSHGPYFGSSRYVNSARVADSEWRVPSCLERQPRAAALKTRTTVPLD